MRSSKPVGILGGMGPAAGAEFLRTFVDECTLFLERNGEVVCDQAYPEHWVAQLPIPDRSAALADPDATQPLGALVAGLERLASLGATSVAIACNTAHVWHASMQAAAPSIRLLNVFDEVATELVKSGVDRAGLLATQGTYASGLYARSLARHGISCVAPEHSERALVMDGIYLGVKRGKLSLAHTAFSSAVDSLVQRHGVTTIILGCTEIPIVLREPPEGICFVDPARLLARRLAELAYLDTRPSQTELASL